MNVILRDDEKIQVKCSEDLFEVMRKILDREEEIDKDREHFWVVGLNAGNWILFVELISLGSIKATVVEPMDVFSFALQKRAVKIIMVHNHPSKDLTPSENDKDLTDGPDDPGGKDSGHPGAGPSHHQPRDLHELLGRRTDAVNYFFFA